jgi:hypothetical protein
MAEPKLGERSRERIIHNLVESLENLDYEVLQVGSASFAIPVVEDGEESAIRIVFQIPKGARDGEGYDPYEEAQAFAFKREEARKKAQKRAEEKAKKLAKQKKEDA